MAVVCRAVFFKLGSTSDCQRFRRNKPKLPGTKFATTVLCGCNNMDNWIIAQVSMSNANICGRPHCQKKLRNTAVE